MKLFQIVQLGALTAVTFSLSSGKLYAQMPNQMAAGQPVAGQAMGNQGLGMILLPVQMGPDGQQYITTRAGYQVAVPGLGIDRNASQIAAFQDAQNNFWYINKNGQPTPVSAQQMQSIMGQVQQQQMQRQAEMNRYPQAMPNQATYPPQAAPAAPAAQTPAPSSGSGSGNSAMVSGLAAAGGAAVGAGLVNAINNNNNEYPHPSYGYGGVPYGQPIYRQPNGQYYYNNPAASANAGRTYVTPNANTTPYFNQYEQQQAQQQQNREQMASQASAANKADQQKQITPQEAQAMQSKEGQESGRRRFGRGRSEEAPAGQAGKTLQSSGAEESGRRRLGRSNEQTAGTAGATGRSGERRRRAR